ncbi:MAG: hypothetical protein BGO98_42575 [Myxococcales bacterium 68-20]|nr:MAG: hypothetical protein BGO98_42575 [Myxococcales bacterium 68-20]
MSSNARRLEPRGDANVTLSIDLAALLARSPPRSGGPLRTTDVPPAARGVRNASIVESYVPSSTSSPR